MPDKMSHEKIAALRAFGAKVVVCPTARRARRSALLSTRWPKRLATETPKTASTRNQYHNLDNPGAHYISHGARRSGIRLGGESTCSSRASAPVAPSRHGQVPQEKKPGVQVVGVDPVGSLYYDFVKTGRVTKPFSYKVEGIGEDFFPSHDRPGRSRRDGARRRQASASS
jgi:cystathionine beta-synthase